LPAWGQAAGDLGISFSPAFSEVEVKADQLRVQYELKLKNHNRFDQNFRLSVVDFGSLDEEGGVAFIGQSTSELEHRYGLASWMTPEKNTVFVPAGGEAKLVVTIDNRASLAPGGHYGAVLATAITDTGQDVVNPRVGVKEVLSSLVLASKDGGARQELKLVQQAGNGTWWRLPTTVALRFQNSGNVHVTPRGVVEVKDPVGTVVQRAAINEGSGVILPESFRRFHTPLMSLQTAWMPGIYQILTTYRYDGTDTTQTITTNVWYCGAVVVWLVALMAALAVAVLAWWLWRPPTWARRLKRSRRKIQTF
jgi:hypothetical protein